jgi:DNA modification methylase
MAERRGKVRRPRIDRPRPKVGQETRVVCGDALEVLAGLPDGLVQTCVTSPPYWGLRDYGVRPRVWGGEAGCRHRWDGEPGGQAGASCRRCGAWKGCLGLEPEPDLYVEHLVAVMREVRRVLREDGTLWLVLGDTFAAHRTPQVPDALAGRRSAGVWKSLPAGLKPKDLVGIPWRVAFALQADGWWLRSDIVWSKPDPTPESVHDRPTRAHEFVFLLTKSRRYLYDDLAVREVDHGGPGDGGHRLAKSSGRGARCAGRPPCEAGGRNRRSVWTIPTRGFRGGHTATFPEALAELCVLAGTSPVACRRCGAPWRRILRSRLLLDGRELPGGGWTGPSGGRRRRPVRAAGSAGRRIEVERTTAGWEAGCGHDAPGGRCLVLDPFAGAGTTGLLAARHGRDFLGIELSADHARTARARIAAGLPAGGSR